MSRPSNGFKLYQRPGSVVWWVNFTAGGKRRRRTTGETDRGAATKAAAAIVFRALEDGSPGGGALLPVSIGEQLDLTDLFAEWVEELEADAKSRSNQRYVARIETDHQYIGKFWSHPSEITGASWERAKRELHHLNGGPLKHRSIAHLANTVRHFLRFCARRRVIAVVPEILSPTNKQIESDQAARIGLDEDQREEFLWALALAGHGRALRIYTTLFETWVRKGTLEAMTRRWIDRKSETITIPAKFNKTGKAKQIDLTPRAAEAIEAELAESKVVELDAPIFGPFDFHQAWDERGGGVFGRALTAAGIDRHGLVPHHSTRTTAASIAGAKPGATISGMMLQGGWDSAQMIEKRYLKPSLAAARKMTRAV